MKHILIIDDDDGIRSVFEQLLENKGYSVETASEGKEGLRKMHARKPDLIITDIMMPEMDGLEVVQKIRDHHSELPVIAISGGMQASAMNFLPLAKRFGACKVFEKPVELAKLLEAVETLLDSTRNGS
jgi:DNA-binding NtrC family response regulator